MRRHSNESDSTTPRARQGNLAGGHQDSPFAQLAAEKEHEWRQLQKLHAQSLEATIKEKDRALSEQYHQFHTLKEDFKYNFKLLAERDQELERLEVSLEQLRVKLQAKEGEVSELKIHIDELKNKQARDAVSAEDLQQHYQQRIREKQAEVEQYRTSKDAEVQKEHDELETFRRGMQRQMREMEEELDIQRREIVAGFDETSRRRENESRSKLNDLSSTVLAHEMKVKLLSKELDLVRSASQQTTAQLSQSDTNMEELNKELKQKGWELSDLKGMKDARIAELESKLQLAQQAVERTGEEFQRKHTELDRYAREKESALTGLKESQAEVERKLNDEIRRLEGEMEMKEVERRREEWAHQDVVKDKEMLIEKLQQEVQGMRNHNDGQLARVSKDIVAKDLVIESLRDKESKLRAELDCRKQDIDRYKKELVQAAEKEQNLERSKAQLELDWQRRYEDAERAQYAKSEDLITRLSKSRDDAVALTKELERELQQRDDLNRILARDRDHAMATLRKHKLQIDRDLIPSKDTGNTGEGLESQPMEELRAQNESLIAVIKDMRREMEEMESQTDRRKSNKHKMEGEDRRDGESTAKGERDRHDTRLPFTEEYVKAMEKECRELKGEKRQLEERLATLAKSIHEGGVLVRGGMNANLSENEAIKSHIRSLNDTIGALRADKVTTSAELRKHQVRLSHLESELAQKQYQPKEKQVEVDQLRYELSAQARRHASETSSVAQHMAQLELQLAETRREADEYYKGTLQTNLEATTLGKQVSELKMDLAGRVNMSQGTQSTLVSQLQREVRNLRSQLARVGPQRAEETGSDQAVTRAKLKAAARHIGRLAKERQQLIEMGNRLRSELALHKPAPVRLPAPGVKQRDPRSEGITAGMLAEELTSKLDNLEQVQYALTKRELQFARQRIDHDEREADIVHVNLSSSSESTPEQTHGNGNYIPSIPDIPQRPEDFQASLKQSHSSDGGVSSSESSATRRSMPPMMSSYGEESLQDVWRLLDDGASPLYFRSPSPMHKPDQLKIPEDPHPSIPSTHHSKSPHDAGLEVAGSSSHLQHRTSRPDKPRLSSMATGKPWQKLQPNKQKVRNYNVRDDEGFR